MYFADHASTVFFYAYLGCQKAGVDAVSVPAFLSPPFFSDGTETKMDKKQTSNEKRFYIPLELTPETVITEQYKDYEVRWSKIGCRRVRTILIPATEEQYRAYMRPLWREDKRQQRHGADETSADRARDDYELEVPDDFDLEESILKKERLMALRRELAALQDIDRTILTMIADGFSEVAVGEAVGLSQKAVNKRKHKLYALLQDRLKDYR